VAWQAPAEGAQVAGSEAWAAHERSLLLAIKWARVDIAKEIMHAISHLGGPMFEMRYQAVNLQAPPSTESV
jgi:hypothetical protein